MNISAVSNSQPYFHSPVATEDHKSQVPPEQQADFNREGSATTEPAFSPRSGLSESSVGTGIALQVQPMSAPKIKIAAVRTASRSPTVDPGAASSPISQLVRTQLNLPVIEITSNHWFSTTIERCLLNQHSPLYSQHFALQRNISVPGMEEGFFSNSNIINAPIEYKLDIYIKDNKPFLTLCPWQMPCPTAPPILHLSSPICFYLSHKGSMLPGVRWQSEYSLSLTERDDLITYESPMSFDIQKLSLFFPVLSTINQCAATGNLLYHSQAYSHHDLVLSFDYFLPTKY